MEDGEMRKRFDEVVLSMISKKRQDNSAFLSVAEYNARLADVKRAKSILSTPGSQKSARDYRLVKKYQVIMVCGKERLIKPVVNKTAPVLYYVTNDELFDIIHSTHTAIGHAGRNRMMAEIKRKYYNITTETIMAYLQLCVHCQNKSVNPKKSFVFNSKPILHSALNSRAQVDVIDMESRSYNGYCFIMVYHDHLTKFVLLRALTSKIPKEVASNLIDIYTIFGAPAILHSDNGREFVSSVLKELHNMWKDVKIVQGKPRHSQSQGLVERANEDIEEMLSAWMAENQCEDWPAGLKFIQFQKNRTFHSAIGKSPYEEMFGHLARVGLASTGLPVDEIANLNKEEDVEAAIKPQEDELTNYSNVYQNVSCHGTENDESSSEAELTFKEEKIEIKTELI